MFPYFGTPTSSTQNSTESLVGKSPRIIAVMGPTGAGKSTFINTVSGVDVQVGNGLESCTQVLQAVSCNDPFQNRDFVFVDTPGFDDTHRSDVEILEEIAYWLEKTYEGGVKLSGVLYLHRITDNRMTNTLMRNLNMFEKLCGKDALSNVIFVTTMWGELEEGDDSGNKHEEELRNNYLKFFLSKGSQMLRFEQTISSAWGIINALPMTQKALKIQKEMVDKNIPLAETSAGRSLFSWLRRATRSLRGLISRLDSLIRGTRSSQNPESIENQAAEGLEAARAKADAGLKDIENQKSRLSRRKQKQARRTK
ncbi:P-loop containing nucleoside triphosphate hydrolase protein [Macrolepiota fuliginosa MF-IS2]|uniref:P-loop containing nucleoside triphosphate hydrolase protein n=1 Tax=Macrolepiota fuliginosa MF-IS2 TaxID=1400762 RepID=A0A9P6C2E9_9AGAR|nr:P-loop containing nucleoside triphosphate hydrolase protein [Macrolepiota fuliginosa MF-IS2]